MVVYLLQKLAFLSFGDVMWHFYFYPLWQIEKIEKYLEEMEKQGYRLQEVKHYYFFKFRKSPAKNVQYIFYYTFLNDFHIVHFNMQQQIKGQFLGDTISKDPNIYRICDTTADLSHIKSFRKQYLKKVLLQKIVLTSIFILPSIALIFQRSMEINLKEIFLGAVGIVSLFILVYYLIGIFILMKK